MKAGFFSHSDCGRHDTGWGHPEHVGRLRAVTRALRNEFDLYHDFDHREGRHATPEELSLAHDPRYVQSVRAMAERGGGRMDADTVVSPGSWDAATAGAGCVVDAVEETMSGRLKRSFCAVRPPGHHALHDRSMGFCLFGNVAIGAHYARQKYNADRVLIVDWDVHHGNGTQALVEHDPGIHFVSMHQWPWYPGTGAEEDRGKHRNVWNVPMPAGRKPQEYVDAWERAVDAACVTFTPDLIIISAGFDSLAGDPLGGFTLELDDITTLTANLVARAESACQGRLVSALEGGYDPDRVAAACIVHMRALVPPDQA